MEKFDRLKDILRTMFQLDRGDLDFGLYRIMNLKAKEIEDFLDNDLLPQVQDALTGNAAKTLAELEEELAKARTAARSLGVAFEATPKFDELQQLLAEARADVAAETDVYNHLANFFARYYDEGDFMSLRRYSSGGQSSYLIPYDGEEVNLHWANSDQYYIKTTENYASYAFTVGAGTEQRRVRFEIAKADNEKDNVKETSGKQRRFLLAEGKNEKAIEITGSELFVRFEHRPLTENEKKLWNGNGNKQQEAINKAAAERILNSLEPAWQVLLAVAAPTENNPERTLLDRHLATYAAKNSFDYFIHKDLDGFLRRELDLYLKTDVLNLDDLEAGDTLRLQRALARTRAVRQVAEKIIAFLAQIEDFQKQLWLKKKFVLETQYCVTLDRVPETLYPEIIQNKAQHDEWVELFAIDEIKGDLGNGNAGHTNPLTVDFLKSNPYLVLDTCHFGRVFIDRLLAALSDDGSLEEQLDGLLVHGENYQALSFLQKRYVKQIKCIHIDPPYNTDTSGFLYKNGYRHSSWMAFMESRILASIDILSADASYLCHIDENEYERLHLLFEQLPLPSAGTAVWDKRNPMNAGRGLALQHEYVIWRSNKDTPIYLRNDSVYSMLKAAERILKKHGGASEEARKEYAQYVVKNKQLTGGEKAYRHLDDDGKIYQSVSLRAPEPRIDPKFHIPLVHPVTRKPCPVPPNGFSRTPETLQAMIEEGEIIFGKDECTQPRQKVVLTSQKRRQASSVIQEARKGKGELDRLGLDFPYCHPVSFYEELVASAVDNGTGIILDYFAGSGTTGHAIINLNREDGGKRKSILIEVGHHFATVLLPRIKKVVYSKDWKDGKPVSRNGSSQFFKYIRLESYEDTLDSLELTPPASAQQDMLARNPALREDYQLRYALGEETSGSASLSGKDFTDPFSYTLSVVRDGVRSEVPVDLPETFNFLIGLRVETRRNIENVLTITGTDPERRRCLILWRNQEELDNSSLDAWFTSNHEHFGTPDVIYVNGDHTLNALKQAKEIWAAKTIEPVFRELMFKTEIQ